MKAAGAVQVANAFKQSGVHLIRSSTQSRSRAPHLRRNQTNLLVRDLFRERFLYGFEPFHSTSLARAGNLTEYFWREPLRLEIDFASFNHLRDQRNDGAQFAIADLRDLLEGSPFL